VNPGDRRSSRTAYFRSGTIAAIHWRIVFSRVRGLAV
jgi:hypothetical protein